MGALGAAILAKEYMKKRKSKSKFKGFRLADMNFKTTSFSCRDCPNSCEVVVFWENGKRIAFFGDKCGKYEK